MAGPEFFQTVMGHRFYEGDVPRLVKVLERIAVALEKIAQPAGEGDGEEETS